MMDWTDAGPVGLMLVVMAVLTILLVVVLVLAINAMYPARGQGNRRPPDDNAPPPTAKQ